MKRQSSPRPGTAAEQLDDFLDKGVRAQRAADAAVAAADQAATGAAKVNPFGVPLDVQVDHLSPDPRNPRGPLAPADVAELASSMAAVGLLQPIVVAREGKGFRVLAGHRRLAAARALGWREIPTLVMDPRRRADLEVALVENEQRQDLDPLRAADAVGRLLGVRGATLDGVAAVLGKSRRWVALRRELQKLSPRARKARAGGVLAEWPAEWLCEFAVLAPAEQDAVLLGRGYQVESIRSRADVRDVVRGHVRKLSDARWDLADATLLPRAGACTTCPKHSASSPGLFEDASASKVATALCRDGPCYEAKLNAWRARVVREKRAELGDQLVIAHGRLGGGYTGSEEEALKRAIGQPIAATDEMLRAKRSDRGAVPVLTIDGPDAGKVRWARRGRFDERTQRTVAARGAPSAGQPRSLAELRAALEARRWRAVLAGLARTLDPEDPKARPPEPRDDHHLLSLVAAFGCDPVPRGKASAGQSEAWHGLHLGAIPRRAQVWASVRRRVLRDHLREHLLRSPPTRLVAQDLCESLRLDIKVMLAEQREKIPEPKAWADRAEAPAGRKGRTRRPAKRKGS